MSSRRRHVQSSGRDQGAQRSSRLNELLREIIADELNRIDDDRLQWVSITHVKTDRSLDRAIVSFTAALGDEDEEAALVDIFEEHRKRLQSAIGRQTTLRRTPPLTFVPDIQLRSANRIEDLLAQERQRPGNPEPAEDVEATDASGESSGPEVSGNPSRTEDLGSDGEA
ncbi:MAG: ribosome-binding factor A [Verrucomicrobiales bacterium]|jgi:ribosome-binding factor A